jgi:hypothetical protein
MTTYLTICNYKGREFVAEQDNLARTFHDVVADVWDGQIDNISRLWRVDPVHGVCYDESDRLARALSETSLDRGERPYPALAAWLDNHFMPYHDGPEYDDRSDRAEHCTYHRAMQF